ncbi:MULTISPECIES: MurR/RpiR family transcriptional regulator [Ruminococcus]|uniref:Transcriptional regulator, RpiR family n=1 Tax=Ruminococcus albus (strain ATCC 27210 / DSM 20455 / JCM 14654 / NCDO 2250 / 7) TaxID=697329 RepID=E6UJ03_RUMA7|nr:MULTISPECIES: MurR/RpiR family transcriptional regulator [Ruminococcus]ADU22269.1 transcriptional regulator, RpiR family [Ruminococcus albus 7 = DSM 20455]MCR5019533.1 MurR/RpiR family transcriptional regulator [Ruminococcus sp.]
MNRDLFSVIKVKLPTLSKGHKLIANYILSQYDKAAFMTAQKLGKTVGVSESTVVRFASELGYDGYPELQRQLQDLMRNKLTAVQRIEVSSEQMNSEDVLQRVLNQDVDRIRATLNATDKNDFNRAVDLITSANTIYIIGTRSSAALAYFLNYYLNLLFPHVKLVPSTTTSELFERIMRIDKNDVMIGISFPRYSNQTVKALKYSKTNGAKVIALTDSTSSPLTDYADALLLAKSDMASFADSLVAPLSLINALIAAISIRNVDLVTQTFGKLEKVWEDFDVYAKNTENAERNDDGEEV